MSSRTAAPVRPVRTDTGEPDLAALRAAVRDWCAANVPAGWQERQTGASHEEFVRFQREWLGTLRAGGLAVPHWPADYGGGFSLAEQAVIFEELARAEAPRLVLHFVSLHHAAATLLDAGTAEQRERHLPAILDGEVWCQGFSEPEAGSDLASLRTRAERRGDVYVVNGQKVWASLAMYADWCLLLARTDPDAPKRRGISYFLMDMRSPGLTVRPIRQAGGEEHFCEIFLTDVEIPAANLIGPENDGWRVAQRTLNTERGATMVELAERLAVGFGRLVDLARRTTGPDGSPMADDSAVRDHLARLATQVRALRLLVARAVAEAESDVPAAGALASVIKLYYSELLQRVTGYGVEIAGPAGQRAARRPMSAGWESGAWLLDFIGSWEWTIPGGTSEIQRSIIGERALGLPREPGLA
ncbi:acyl-CoA dehydrogenase [Actinomadura sp. NBRC 104412]|uniref:acyl-CoA dehydrogenase family protein n=1 Tax=Actinomadura sp. NBRC 104412 TaxID=3032203 RepID=UPI0024A5A60C|nr:acyl-CoA dehydrogenase family protein [Actinomadura sp. NBRC 104412]GLZ06176.1 acyl-CoA dehydrogenase [Actinomadura sp. NBRC 104412]